MNAIGAGKPTGGIKWPPKIHLPISRDVCFRCDGPGDNEDNGVVVSLFSCPSQFPQLPLVPRPANETIKGGTYSSDAA